MKIKLKKIFLKKITLPPPEEVFNRKAVLFAMIILAFFFDFSILNLTKSFLATQEPQLQTKIISPLERNIKKLVAGYPIEKMVPFISTKEKRTAAFLIGIAKKESNWGKYSPKLNGKDCYNYWGYRGQNESMTPSGYTCFASPKQAVNVVGKRINTLTNDSGLSTPAKMIVWKCGWNCAGHSNQSVDKWIADVGMYYNKIYQ